MPFYRAGIEGTASAGPFYLSWKAKQFGSSRASSNCGRGDADAALHGEKVAERSTGAGSRSTGEGAVLASVQEDISDVRESPASTSCSFCENGAHLSYCDPYVPQVREAGMTLAASPFSAATLRKATACDRDEPRASTIKWSPRAKMIVDTRTR